MNYSKKQDRRAPLHVEPITRYGRDPNWPTKPANHTQKMVLYSFEAVIALMNQIKKIQGRPTFGSLWHLAQAFYDALRKLDHADHPTDGWSGYLMTKEEFALRSATNWTQIA